MKKKRCTCTLHRVDNELIQLLGTTMEDGEEMTRPARTHTHGQSHAHTHLNSKRERFKRDRQRNGEEKLHLSMKFLSYPGHSISKIFLFVFLNPHDYNFIG